MNIKLTSHELDVLEVAHEIMNRLIYKCRAEHPANAEAAWKKSAPVDDATWHSGPPPSLGWWPASNSRSPATFRWWDGRRWSMVVYRHASAETAAHAAQTKNEIRVGEIKWRHRPADWPARSHT